MKEKIAEILKEVTAFHAETKEALEDYRIKFLSKKGIIPGLFADFKQVAPEMRKEIGMLLNELKTKHRISLMNNRETLIIKLIAVVSKTLPCLWIL